MDDPAISPVTVHAATTCPSSRWVRAKQERLAARRGVPRIACGELVASYPLGRMGHPDPDSSLLLHLDAQCSALSTGRGRLGRDRHIPFALPSHEATRGDRRPVRVRARPIEALVGYGVPPDV